MNKPTTITIRDPTHLFSMISDSALDISTLRLCTDDILETVYTSVGDNAPKGTKTNIFLAAFTTCHTRLKLYESLHTLKKAGVLLPHRQCGVQVASRSAQYCHREFSGAHDG